MELTGTGSATALSGVKLAILGAGNMGQAILAGALRAGVPASNISVTTADDGAKPRLESKFGVNVAESNAEAVADADVVVVAVKPYQVAEVLSEVAPFLSRNSVVVSVAVGIDLATLQREAALAGFVPHFVRAMPNTPAMVGQGITAFSPSDLVTDQQLELAKAIFEGSGRVIVVPEKYQPAVGAISGSGPAYVAYFIDALIEAGVHQGLPRDVATALAVGTFEGSAAMLRETGDHPAVAREKVTSPGGTTAAALAELDNSGVRAAIIRAVAAAIRRTKEIATEG